MNKRLSVAVSNQGDIIPGDWIKTRKLKNEIQQKMNDIFDQPEFKDLPYDMIVAAMTQATAEMAADQLRYRIKGNRKKTGFAFPYPI